MPVLKSKPPELEEDLRRAMVGFVWAKVTIREFYHKKFLMEIF